MVVVKPDAGSLVALVVNVDVGRVPLFRQFCFAVGTSVDGLPELNITSFGPIAHPSILLAIFPSRADNRKTDSIAFPLVIANLLQIDVNRLLALMTRAHRQCHIHVRPLLDLVVGVVAGRTASRACDTSSVLGVTVFDGVKIGVVSCDEWHVASSFIETARRV